MLSIGYSKMLNEGLPDTIEQLVSQLEEEIDLNKLLLTGEVHLPHKVAYYKGQRDLVDILRSKLDDPYEDND